jgi:hypothetical protein
MQSLMMTSFTLFARKIQSAEADALRIKVNDQRARE